MKIEILNRKKKKKLIEGISNFGIKNIPQLLIKSGIERIRAYSGNLSNEEINELWRLLPIEGIGLYVGKETIDKHGTREVRLSVDGLHLWKDQITKNVLVLNEKQEKEWFLGKNIEFERSINLKGFVAVKSSDEKDFIGMGKISDDGLRLFSFLPKERRRKESVI